MSIAQGASRRFTPLLCAAALLIAGAPAAFSQATTKEESVRQCVAALRAQPERADAREQLRRLFTEAYPKRLPADAEPLLPVAHEAREDRICASGPARRSLIITALAFPDAAHRRDPVGAQPFNRAVHAYTQESAGGEWILRFRVLYDARDPGAEALAPRVMRDLLRVYAAYASLVGGSPSALADTVDVWLRGEGDGGAETNGNCIYLLGTEKSREPMELLRQIAHEFGHLTLAGVGPLTAPEPWGNGYLGEAIFLRWLARAPAGDEAIVPAETLSAYVKREIDPFAAEFAALTGDPFAGCESGPQGLRRLIGLLLHLEDTRGTPALVQVLRGGRTAGVREWADAAEKAMKAGG